MLDDNGCADPFYAARILDVVRGMLLGRSIAVPVHQGGATALMDHLLWFTFTGEVAVGVIKEEHFSAVVITLKRRLERGKA